MFYFILLLVAISAIAILLWQNYKLKKQNDSCEKHIDLLDKEIERWKTIASSRLDEIKHLKAA